MTDKNDFLLLVSQTIRHEVANILFVAGGNLALYNEEQNPKRLETIRKSLEELDSLMNLWKDLELIGEDDFWQDLESLLMRTIIVKSSVKIMFEVPEVKIKANGLFGLVFTNFIENTIKYSGKSFPCVKIWAEEEKDGNLLIVYEDDGVGISELEKDIIFNKGYGKNTGLGLFFIKEIVEMIGGTVKETGTNGVRFEVRVPECNFRTTYNKML